MYNKQFLETQDFNFSWWLNTDFISSDTNEYSEISNLIIDSNWNPTSLKELEQIWDILWTVKNIWMLWGTLLVVTDTHIKKFNWIIWENITTCHYTWSVYIENFKTTNTSIISTVSVKDESTNRVIKANWLTINEFAWKMVKIPWWNTKMILSNTTDEILIDWILENVPASGINITIHEPINTLVIVWDWDNVKEWTWGSSIKDLWFTYKSVCKKHNKLWYINWIDNKLYFSEIWSTDKIPKNNFLLINDIPEKISQIKETTEKIVIYWKNTRVDLYWQDQDNFELLSRSTVKWIYWINSVANWQWIQFFFSNQWLERISDIDNSKELQWKSLTDKFKSYLSTINTKDWFWAVYDSKYWYTDWNKILIFDFENSYYLRNKIFSIIDDNWDYIKTLQDNEIYINKWWKLYKFWEWTFSSIGYITTNEKKQGTLQIKKFYNQFRLAIRDINNLSVKIFYNIDNKGFIECLSKTWTEYITGFIRKTWKTIKIKIEFTSTNKTEKFIIDENTLYFRYLTKFIWKK